MPNFILTRRAVILCPHAGMVMHLPLIFSGYLIDGEMVMKMGDQYTVAGCPGTGMGDNCATVLWTTGSLNLIIKGSPALTNVSVGLCQSANGAATGPAIIAQFQTRVPEPDTLTIINS